jgi:modulator of FtsH protease HflC
MNDTSSNSTFGYTIAGIATLLWMSSSLYIQDARDVSVVTMFGEPIHAVTEAGLGFKAPWPIQKVERFDARAQLLEIEPVEVFTKDTKNLVVSPYVIWKIKEPVVFMERIRSLEDAQRPIEDLVTSRIASAIGRLDFSEIFHSTDQSQNALLPEDLVSQTNTQANRLGIHIESISIEKLSLPIQNEQSIYERMRAERSRIARKYRSEGEELASAIRAKSEREAVQIRVEAQSKASEIIATAEKQANEIYQQTYSQDPDLYKLIRDLESVEASLHSGGTLILSSEDRPFSTLLQEKE